MVDRIAGETGVCRIGARAHVASAAPHFGEEGPLVGVRGSGTVFFSGCNLRCSFCQNADISHRAAGPAVDSAGLARVMIEFESHGCHNLNLVTPSHVVPQILSALEPALDDGFSLPIVYNSSGYDSVETLKLLDGVVDIYMPDLKFWHGEGAPYMENVDDYAEVATAAVTEMHRQVGDLHLVRGVAVSGLLVRHLVMPGHVTDTRAIMRFLASLSPETYVNVMDQYRPSYRACGDPAIGRPAGYSDYAAAIEAARDAGLRRIEGHL